jgi:hypothetical protein
VKHQGNIIELHGFNDGCGSAGCSIQAYHARLQPGTLPSPRAIETDAAKIWAQTLYHIAPNERPTSGMHEQQHRPLAYIGDGDLGALHVPAPGLKGPDLLGKPGWTGKGLQPRDRVVFSNHRSLLKKTSEEVTGESCIL